MELELSREQIKINQKVHQGRMEHVENIEIIVPDYLPDALRVIETDAEVFIKDKTIADEKISVSGEIVFNALYLPENMTGVKPLKTKVPFKDVFHAKGATPDTVARVDLNLGLVEGTIVNSRKINLKAVVEIDVKAYQPTQMEIINKITDADNNQLETLTKPVGMLALTNICEKEFGIEEDMYLPAGKQMIGELLKSQVSVFLVDCKVISNKAIIKGGASVKSLYTAQDDGTIMESVENEIPFSMIVDIDGIDEEHIIDVSFNLSDVNIRAAQDSDGDARQIMASIHATASVLAYKNIAIDCIVDTYSMAYDLNLNRKETTVMQLYDNKTLPIMIKDTVVPTQDQPDIKKVINLSARSCAFDILLENDELKLTSSADISVICAGGADGNEIFCIKKTLPVYLSQPISSDAEGIYADMFYPQLNTSYNLNMSGELELRLTGDVQLRTFELKQIDLLENVIANEKKQVDLNALPLLWIYYPQSKETVWDISKKYGVRASDLISVNKLDGQIADELNNVEMLLVPVRRK